MHVQGWGMLNRESGKKSFGDGLLDYEKISWREFVWGMKKIWREKKILKESSWQWKRVLDVCIVGTGKSFRRWKEEMMCFGDDVFWERGRQLWRGRTIQTGQLKEKEGRKLYDSSFNIQSILKQLMVNSADIAPFDGY